VGERLPLYGNAVGDQKWGLDLRGVVAEEGKDSLEDLGSIANVDFIEIIQGFLLEIPRSDGHCLVALKKTNKNKTKMSSRLNF